MVILKRGNKRCILDVFRCRLVSSSCVSRLLLDVCLTDLSSGTIVLDYRKRMHRHWDAPRVRRIFAKMLNKHAVWLLESVPVAILAPPASEQDDPMDGHGWPSQMPAAFTLVSSPTRRRNVSQLLDHRFTSWRIRLR